MKNLFAISLIIFLSKFILAQDVILVNKSKSRLFIELGGMYNIPFKANYIVNEGSMSTCYHDYTVREFQTPAFNFNIGYNFIIRDRFYFQPNLNYNYMILKQERMGYTTGMLCLPVIAGKTYSSSKGKLHLLGISLNGGVKLKKVIIENGIGLYLWQYANNYNYIFNIQNKNINEKFENTTQEQVLFLFSAHKLGYSIKNKKLSFLIGIQINYSSALTKSIAPTLTLRKLF